MIKDEDRAILVLFGERLRKLRESANLTYRELSLRSGVNTGEIIKYEKGESGPSFLTLKKLALGFRITPSQLLDTDFGIDFSEGLR